jgi:hypothetical protein
MTPKEEALYLVQHFSYQFEIRDYKKAKDLSIYLAHRLVMETLDLKRIKYWKDVVNEIEKL